MQLEQLQAFKDNYIWLVIETNEKAAIVIDPGDAAPVIRYLSNNKLELQGILLTHHHADHTAGIETLRQRWPDAAVWGPLSENIGGLTNPLTGGELLTPLPSLSMHVMSVPGHTRGHLAYHCPQHEWLFCGDTLFSGGCGRVFEGTHEQMYRSLMLLRELPGNTLVCCAHEYTQANLRFAQTVEPDNIELARYADHVKQLRDSGKPTVPRSLRDELRINPFLRCDQPPTRLAAEHYSGSTLDHPVMVFSVLRHWKDIF